MRDLAEDAAKGAMLLTLPDTLFQNLGTDATAFASDPTPALVHAARKEVAGFAEQFLAPAWLELAALDEALAPGDAAVLRGLCEPYIERYETFAASL